MGIMFWISFLEVFNGCLFFFGDFWEIFLSVLVLYEFGGFNRFWGGFWLLLVLWKLVWLLENLKYCVFRVFFYCYCCLYLGVFYVK